MRRKKLTVPIAMSLWKERQTEEEIHSSKLYITPNCMKMLTTISCRGTAVTLMTSVIWVQIQHGIKQNKAYGTRMKEKKVEKRERLQALTKPAVDHQP